MRISIENGKVLDPSNKIDQKQNIFIADGKIVSLKKKPDGFSADITLNACLLYTSPSPRDLSTSRMPSSA